MQLKVVHNIEKKFHFKMYYGVLNLSWIFFQIYISLAVILLVYFIKRLDVHLFSSIVWIHVSVGLQPSFSISSLSHGIMFVAVMAFMK